jgi:acyl carrier protein
MNRTIEKEKKELEPVNSKTRINIKLKKIIAEILKCEIENINQDSNISRDLGADSLDVLDLVIAIENEFEVEFPQDGEFQKLSTFEKIEEYVMIDME